MAICNTKGLDREGLKNLMIALNTIRETIINPDFRAVEDSLEPLYDLVEEEWRRVGGLRREKNLQPTYEIGQIFKTIGTIESKKYILSHVGLGMVTLICIEGKDKGERWREPVKVEDIVSITTEELGEVVGTHFPLQLVS